MTIRRHVLAGIAAVLAAPLAVSAPAFASDLPDLGGKTVVVVTENAYPPAAVRGSQIRPGHRLGI